jgi:hypothetical protein
MPYKRTGGKPGRPKKPPVRAFLTGKGLAVALLDHHYRETENRELTAGELRDRLSNIYGIDVTRHWISKVRNDPRYSHAHGPGLEQRMLAIKRSMLADALQRELKERKTRAGN